MNNNIGTTTRRADLCRWWVNKDTRRKGTPVVVRMENPNYSVLEFDGPDATFRPIHKDRGNYAKQYTWVLLLKAHCATGFMSWLANILWALIGHRIPQTLEIRGWLHTLYITWLEFRLHCSYYSGSLLFLCCSIPNSIYRQADTVSRLLLDQLQEH